MFTELKNIPEAWRKAWALSAYRNQFVLTVLVFLGSCMYQFYYLRLWQARSGVQVNDVIQNMLPPFDFSIPIFTLEYSVLLIVFIFVLAEPVRLIKGLQMFAMLMLARAAAVYFVPLEPPADMVFLHDPMAEMFLHTKEVIVTKDLFFSGHVSSLALLGLIATNRYIKMYAAFATVAVALLIVWQHVHYSMDVAFAPVVSYVIYRFVEWGHTQAKAVLELQDI
jgi:hypothetical protein